MQTRGISSYLLHIFLHNHDLSYTLVNALEKDKRFHKHYFALVDRPECLEGVDIVALADFRDDRFRDDINKISLKYDFIIKKIVGYKAQKFYTP